MKNKERYDAVWAMAFHVEQYIVKKLAKSSEKAIRTNEEKDFAESVYWTHLLNSPTPEQSKDDELC